MKYCCIVPAYNEYPRIIDVLEELSKVTEIDQIICVDDGSLIDITVKLAEKFPKVVFFRHEVNRGKFEAIKSGLSLCKNEGVILLDGDLINLNCNEISQAIVKYEKNSFDCLLLCTQPINFIDNLARILIRLPHAATGSRIIKKTLLDEVTSISGVLGYQLEFMQNDLLIRKKSKVGYTNISAVNVHKTKKFGWFKGVKGEIEMWSSILFHLNLKIIFQSIYFGRKKI